MPPVDPSSLLLFSVSAFALIVVPGPAVFYVVARSISQGPAAGMVSALGIGLGASVHVAGAVLGVSAVIMASATAFTALKIAGAVYLVWLGIRAFRERDEVVRPDARMPRRGMLRVFVDGLVVNIFNPKVALFFVAFLPQFADRAAGSVPAQLALLGGLFVLIGIVSDGAYALVAGGLAARVRASARAARLRRWFSGTVYIGLGVGTALVGAGDDARP